MSSPPPPANRQLEIRKYPNRRYYDTSRSCHVTLEQIHSLIRDGYDIQVTDTRTGKDITAKVLAQIIMELDPPKLDIFPVPLLHKLLRSSEQIVNDFVQKYFNEALNSFIDSQRNVEQVMRSAMGLPPSAPTLADLTKIMWSPLKNVPSASSDTPPSAAAPPAHSPPPIAPSEAAELRNVVAQLQEEVACLRRDQKSRRHARRRKP
jgi:polyhydroxyalkanoate synthesis repressor PhaR